MKSRIFGGLCCAAFILTSATYLSVVNIKFGPQDTTRRPVHHKAVGPDQALLWPWSKQKAVALAAVGWEGCPPCKRLKKETLKPLLEEGYDVGYSLSKDWNGPRIRVAPTLFYLNEKGQILKREEGFKTADHIKQFLVKRE